MDLMEVHHSDKTGFSRHYLLLYSIVLGMESKNVFEFGCGISTQVILKALEKTGGKLITCDMRPIEETGNTRDLLNHKNWQYRQELSSEALPKVKETGFDVVLHDGAHDAKTVKADLRQIVRKMKKGGILLIHDTEHPDLYGRGMLRAVKRALRWTRKEIITLPYGYGLTIVRINSDYGNGKINIKWRKKK